MASLDEVLRPTAPAVIRAYREELAGMLAAHFPASSVQPLWRAGGAPGSGFMPRVDIAVSPSADSGGFDELICAKAGLVYALFQSHCANLRAHGQSALVDFRKFCSGNPEARCFLAFDMETGASGKHLIGALINTAAVGRIGIAVAWTGVQLKALIEARRYLLELEKPHGEGQLMANLVLLTARQVEACVRQHGRMRSRRRSSAFIGV